MKTRNIIIGIAVLLLSVISFFGYFIYKFERLEDRHIRLVEGEVNNIQLINLGEGDRAYIARVINQVNSCSPAVIALDITFATYDSTSINDSLLLTSISTSNTILAARYKMGTIYDVHSNFLDSAYDCGYAQVEVDEDNYVIDFSIYEKKYKSLYEKNHGAKKIFHFAYKIANEFDSIAAAKYLKDTVHPRTPIVISRLTDQFNIHDYQDLDFPCDDLRGKIVILGYLGPTNEDKHTTYARYHTKKYYGTNEPDMYGPIIVANQILMILEGIH